MCACNGKEFGCDAYAHFTAQLPNTVLLRFVTHAPLTEHAPLLKYCPTEVHRNLYDIGEPGFSTDSQNVGFRL